MTNWKDQFVCDTCVQKDNCHGFELNKNKIVPSCKHYINEDGYEAEYISYAPEVFVEVAPDVTIPRWVVVDSSTDPKNWEIHEEKNENKQRHASKDKSTSDSDKTI